MDSTGHLGMARTGDLTLFESSSPKRIETVQQAVYDIDRGGNGQDWVPSLAMPNEPEKKSNWFGFGGSNSPETTPEAADFPEDGLKTLTKKRSHNNLGEVTEIVVEDHSMMDTLMINCGCRAPQTSQRVNQASMVTAASGP